MKKLFLIGIALTLAFAMNAQKQMITSAWSYLKDGYLDDAKKAIKAAGFKVGNITYDWDSSIGKGYVIYQQYQANSQLDKGTAIDLQVSSGPEPAPEQPVVPETTPDAGTVSDPGNVTG